MNADLPPLNAVRAFLAAARYESFTQAAAALHVTHGAISRQVKALEAHLGLALFERQVRQVRLTAAGQQFLAEAGPALEQVATAARRLRAQAPARAVRVHVRPSFAVRWLIPRLSDFVARHPGIDPQIITSTVAPDAADGAYDIAIRRGLDHWPASLAVQPWMDDEAVLVGAPAVLGALREPRDLAGLTLLLSKTRRSDWEDWKRHAGLARLRPARQILFDHLHFVVQAAVDGLGFTVAPVSLLGNELALGRLVCALPQWRLPLTPYYLGVPPAASPAVRGFAQWLQERAAVGAP